MMLWIRVRRLPACLITVAMMGLVIELSGGQALALPNLLGGPARAIPLALVVPLAIPVVVAWALTTGNASAEAVASRPMAQFDVVYTLTISGLGLAVCVMAQHLGSSELGDAAGRNVLGYLGLTFCGRRLFGAQAAPVLALAFIIVVSLFGSGPDRHPFWWAWPLAPGDLVLPWALALATLASGLGVTRWGLSAIASGE